MNTQIALIALTTIAIGSTLAGCSAEKLGEQTREQKAASCRGMVDTLRYKPTSVAEIVDGQEGTYKLTDLRVYVETKDGDKLSYMAARTLIDINADPNPTPTPTPSATPTPEPTPEATATPASANGSVTAETPAPAPAKPVEPVQITTDTKILCDDTSDFADSDIHGQTEAPLAISRKDGKTPEAMNFKMKAEFQKFGEKTTVAEKSVSKAATEKATEIASPLENVVGSSATRSFYKMNDSKAFGVRVEETQGNSKQISILVYKLAPKK